MKPYIWSPWRTAAVDPARAAIVVDGEAWSFGRLVTYADRLGDSLRGLRLPDGAVISTDLPCRPEFFALALAALKGGFGLLPMNRGVLSDPGGPDLPARVDARLHVGDSTVNGVATITLDDLLSAGRHAAADGAATAAPAAGYLMYVTSGTTGAPVPERRARPWYPYKGVAVYERYAAGLGLGPHVMSNPTFHLGTLGPALYALQAGSAVVVQRKWSPAGFLALVEEHRADSAFISADRLVDLVAGGVWSRHRPRVILHGGSTCTPYVKRAAITSMGPVLHEYYGTSAGIISEITTAQWLRRPGSVGRPLPGVSVSIEAAGITQPPGEPGEIIVRLRTVDQLAGTPVVRTGDLGFLDADGYLFVLGRVAGTHYWRHAQLEHTIRGLDGVTDCVVLPDPAGPSAQASCLVEAVTPDAGACARLVQALADEAGLKTSTVEVHPPNSLPRGRSGKIERRRLVPASGPAPS